MVTTPFKTPDVTTSWLFLVLTGAGLAASAPPSASAGQLEQGLEVEEEVPQVG